jgi:hypothetical protein
MPISSHQTIKLTKGKHSSPASGACVMELASMLAGESFTDHPQSVCPVIASFLRAYNDSVDDDRRQDLYAYASKAVGSRASAEIEHARAQRLIAWTELMRAARWPRTLLPPRLRAALPRRRPPLEAAGANAVQAIRRHSGESHAAVLALIDELLELGARRTTWSTPAQTPGRETHRLGTGI